MSAETRFIDFLRRYGSTISDGIELTSYVSDGSGRKVIATRDIAKGEVLFSVPRSILLNHVNSKCGTVVKKCEKFSGWTPTIICMMYEYVQGNASKWKPYFDILPNKLGVPINWSQEELKNWLGEIPLASLVGHDAVKESYKDVIKFMTQNHKVFGPPARYPFELFVRMGSLVGAYSFAVETGESDAKNEEDEDEPLPLSIVPMADMLNHKAGCNNARIFDEDPNELRMLAIKPINKGEECFNTYGESLPNSQLLRQYGFVDLSPSQLRRDVAMIPEIWLQEWSEKKSGKTASVRMKMARSAQLLDEDEGSTVIEVACRVRSAHAGGITCAPDGVLPDRELLSLVFLLGGASNDALKATASESATRYSHLSKGRALRRLLDNDRLDENSLKRDEEADHEHNHESDEDCCGKKSKCVEDAEEESDDEHEAVDVDIQSEEDDEIEFSEEEEEEDEEEDPNRERPPFIVRKGTREALVHFLTYILESKYGGSSALDSSRLTDKFVNGKEVVLDINGELDAEWMAKVVIASEARLIRGLLKTAENEACWIEKELPKIEKK